MPGMSPHQRALSEEGRCVPCMGRGRRLLNRVQDKVVGMMVNGPVRCPDCDGTGWASVARAAAPGELMVGREGRFHDLQILSVVEGHSHFAVSFLAGHGEWFAPEHDDADPAGWLRDVKNITGDLTIGCEDPEVRARWGAWLRAWERDGRTDLKGIASLQHQAVALGDPQAGRWVAVKMSPEQLDAAG